MGKLPAPLKIALCAFNAVSGIVWAYASHKYDCFNIGPCRGNVDLWINLQAASFYAFLASWLGLLALVVVGRPRPARNMAIGLVAILVAPPAISFLASSAFNIGVSASGGG